MQEEKSSTWRLDQGHSSVQFKIRHLAIANVAGTFDKFEGLVKTPNEDFSGAEVVFKIDARSLSTNNPDRDAHLGSDLFFDTARFPHIEFDGRLVKTTDEYKLLGKLTIRDITREIALQVEPTGTGTGRFGDQRAGFELSGKINRKDFGLTFNLLTEAGSMVVGEEVKIIIDIELVR